MAIEDHLEEAAYRCLDILLRYRVGERTAATRAAMVAAVGRVVETLREFGPPPEAVEGRVLRPLEDYLLGRYGHEAGQRLNAEFVMAFEAAGMGLLARKQIAMA